MKLSGGTKRLMGKEKLKVEGMGGNMFNTQYTLL